MATTIDKCGAIFLNDQNRAINWASLNPPNTLSIFAHTRDYRTLHQAAPFTQSFQNQELSMCPLEAFQHGCATLRDVYRGKVQNLQYNKSLAQFQSSTKLHLFACSVESAFDRGTKKKIKHIPSSTQTYFRWHKHIQTRGTTELRWGPVRRPWDSDT